MWSRSNAAAIDDRDGVACGLADVKDARSMVTIRTSASNALSRKSELLPLRSIIRPIRHMESSKGVGADFVEKVGICMKGSDAWK